jgi:hypothetical protein
MVADRRLKLCGHGPAVPIGRQWEKGRPDAVDLRADERYSFRSNTRATWVAVHRGPPRAVGTPRSLSARAIAQSVSTPLCCRSWIMGRRSAARSPARLTWMARPVALAFSDNTAPQLPPRTFPRAFAAASAAFVLLEIRPASSSATAATALRPREFNSASARNRTSAL